MSDPIDDLPEVIVPNVTAGHTVHHAEALHRMAKGLPRVIVEADNTGVDPINTYVLAAAATLPNQMGVVMLGPGRFAVTPGLVLPDGVILDGMGCSGNVANDGATCLVPTGNGTMCTVGNRGGLFNIDCDGTGRTGIAFHFLGERIKAAWVSARKHQTNFRWGSTDGGGQNSSQFVGVGIFSYGATGTSPFTGGVVAHDTTTPSPTAPNCDSGVITGLEVKGCAGGGCTWGAANGWLVMQSRVSLNGGLGHELTADNNGLRLEMPYTEANGDGVSDGRDITIRAGAAEYKITTPRWGTPLGNSWLDENEPSPLGMIEGRPNNTNRNTINRMDFDRIHVSSPDISGYWTLSQDAADRALEVTLEGSAASPVQVRFNHAGGGVVNLDIPGGVVLDGNLDMTLGGDINLSNASNVAMSSSVGSMIGTAATQKIGFWGATPIPRPVVTGSRGGNAALTSALAQLAAAGLIVDSSSA